jgi:hypothetical protein
MDRWEQKGGCQLCSEHSELSGTTERERKGSIPGAGAGEPPSQVETEVEPFQTHSRKGQS